MATARRPLRLAIGIGLAAFVAMGSASAQSAGKASTAPERAQALRCFMLSAGAANSVQRQNGPAEQVSAFNTVAMFHLGRLVGGGAAPSAAQLEAELRAEQGRPANGRQAALRTCGEQFQRALSALGGSTP